MTMLAARPTTRFPAPDDTTAPAPPERRGVRRDRVRMLVARRPGQGIGHREFCDLPEELSPKDLLVVNTSATIAAEVDGRFADHGGEPVVVHVATPLDDGSWVVELRTAPRATAPLLDTRPGQRIDLGDGQLTLLAAYPREHSSPTGIGNRLWRVAVRGNLPELLDRRGRAIAYGYLDRSYPLADYQTVFSRHPGSAEMPSPGRPFTTDLVTALITRGVGVVPITLHTGLSSPDVGEAPQPERFSVPEATAAAVNATRARGSRVVAVGTRVTRALESAVDGDARVVPATGWTDRVITPDEPARVVDGLITGWHNPEASHLLLVESIAGPELTQAAYDAAVAHGYLWHEFGDSALLLPDRP